MQSPSLFPVLFAALVARAAKSVAQWRLEKGVAVGYLDQLVGSTSMISTFSTQYKLRAFNILALALVTLWTLSPVGGQASLRLLETGNKTTTTQISLNYLNMSANMLAGFDVPGNKAASMPVIWGAAGALYGSSLFSPRNVVLSKVDTWGNPKIPMLESIDGASSSNDWFTPPENTTYSSSIGLSIAGVPDTGKSTFMAQSGYFYFDCFGYYPTADHRNATCGVPGLLDDLDNLTWPHFPTSRERAPRNISKDDFRLVNYCPIPYGKDRHANCSLSTSYVDVELNCVNKACEVSQIRRSQASDLPPPSWTVFDGVNNAFAFSWLMYQWSLLAGNSIPISGYIVDPNNQTIWYATDNATTTRRMALEKAMTDKDMSIRLSQLLNTFWSASIGYATVQSGLDLDKTLLSSMSAGYRSPSMRTVAQHSQFEEVMIVNNGWLAIFLISILLLTAISFLGFAASVLSRGPEIGYYLSSMLKDNRHITADVGSSALSASDRARAMKHLRVKYGDISHEDEVGYIAIAAADSYSRPAPFQPNRAYY